MSPRLSRRRQSNRRKLGATPDIPVETSLDGILPPIIESRDKLPIRFSALWKDEALDQSVWGGNLEDLWPAELWEVHCALLWMAIKKSDARWAARFRSALLSEVILPSLKTRNIGDLLHRAKSFRGVTKGPRKGSTRVPRNLFLLLHKRFVNILRSSRHGKHGYKDGTLSALERAWRQGERFGNPKEPFPAERLSKDVTQNQPPGHIARLLLAKWFQVKPTTVAVYLKRFRRGIPKRILRLTGLSP
jgi:hypothetical protein